MQQQGLQWVSEAVAVVPESALSASDRQKLLGVLQIAAINGPEASNYGWALVIACKCLLAEMHAASNLALSAGCASLIVSGCWALACLLACARM